jgi:hypothetical protein
MCLTWIGVEKPVLQHTAPKKAFASEDEESPPHICYRDPTRGVVSTVCSA